MALDPRLAHTQLLAIAALRLRQRQENQTDPTDVGWLSEYLDDPTEARRRISVDRVRLQLN